MQLYVDPYVAATGGITRERAVAILKAWTAKRRIELKTDCIKATFDCKENLKEAVRELWYYGVKSVSYKLTLWVKK